MNIDLLIGCACHVIKIMTYLSQSQEGASRQDNQRGCSMPICLSSYLKFWRQQEDSVGNGWGVGWRETWVKGRHVGQNPHIIEFFKYFEGWAIPQHALVQAIMWLKMCNDPHSNHRENLIILALFCIFSKWYPFWYFMVGCFMVGWKYLNI